MMTRARLVVARPWLPAFGVRKRQVITDQFHRDRTHLVLKQSTYVAVCLAYFLRANGCASLTTQQQAGAQMELMLLGHH